MRGGFRDGELEAFNLWLIEYLKGGGKVNEDAIAQQAKKLLKAMHEESPHPDIVPDPPGNLRPWGRFIYDEDAREVIRDNGEIIVPLVDNEHELLMALFTHPSGVTYEDLGIRLGFERDRSKITRVVHTIRPKIGDVYFGRDPEISSSGLWRYINPHGFKGNNAGLILLNRSSHDAELLIKLTAGPYYKRF